jgi:hypothetical protein
MTYRIDQISARQATKIIKASRFEIVRGLREEDSPYGEPSNSVYYVVVDQSDVQDSSDPFNRLWEARECVLASVEFEAQQIKEMLSD